MHHFLPVRTFPLPGVENGSCTNILVTGNVTARDPVGTTGVMRRLSQISSMTTSGRSVTAMHAAITKVALFVSQLAPLAVLPLGMAHLPVLKTAVSLLLRLLTDP